MSINWVMLEKGGFAPLPGEQRLYTSPPRTAISVKNLNNHRDHKPFSVQSSTGTAYLTNRRLIYIPSQPTLDFQSFAVPILNVHDSHVTAPFFGPNVWTAVVQPVPGGNIPPEHAALEAKLTFKDGGAFDFQGFLERIKERLQQAVEAVREAGGDRGMEMNLNGAHMEDLPAYENRETTELVSSSPPRQDDRVLEPIILENQEQEIQHPQPGFVPPSEPPPGYEETQRNSLIESLERSARQAE